MALTYADFTKFPIQIIGIDANETIDEEVVYLYDEKIEEIEDFVISDIAYSGEAADLTAILPYFVFWYFCNDATSQVVVESGENGQVKEFSYPEVFKQVQAWNIGVDKLRAVFEITDDKLNLVNGSMSQKIHALVLAAGKTINEKYLSKRSLL
jgi:hypothetical protein